jgi:hypothetical protein
MLRINHLYYKLRNGLALIVPMKHVLNNTAKVKKQRKHFQKFCYKSGHHEAYENNLRLVDWISLKKRADNV